MKIEHNACPSHCCKEHGCKYGYDDCPVVLGTAEQEFRQECCDDADHHLAESYEYVINHLNHIKFDEGVVKLLEGIVKKYKFKRRDRW